ncbi:MAG: imelysin [Bacteroidales bacterium]|nr:imelysin [Bacteroidales bacterium]
MKNIFKFLAIAATAALAVTACDKDERDNSGVLTSYEKEIKAASEQYLSKVVYATYGKLADAGTVLYEDLAALRDAETISQAAIDKACADFLTARQYWEESEAFLFGAATDFGIDPHIDSWPLDRKRLAINLSNKDVVAQLKEEGAGAIDLVGASALGFHGIEFILFRDGANRTVAALNAEEDAAEFQGKAVTGEQELIFAAAVAEDLMIHLYELNVSWNADAPKEQQEAVEEAELNCTVNGTDKTYGEVLAGAAEKGSNYATWQEVAQTVLSAGCANIANEVFSSKMGQAYSGEDESYIESPYSKKSFVDFKDNILSIQNSLYGSYEAGSVAANSFLSFLKKHHASEASKIESTLADALKALQACIDSKVAFVDNPKAAYVKTAIDAISALNDALEEAAAAIKD